MCAMAVVMGPGEQVVFDTHPHWSRLVGPVLVLLVVSGLAGYGVALAPGGRYQDPVRWAILGLAVVVVCWFSVARYLRWVTTRYVLTTGRLVVRTGIVARHGRDVPLNRINDVAFSQTALERLLRAGTLVVESAGERGQLCLSDVPRVERVQLSIYRMVERDERRQQHDGEQRYESGQRYDGDEVSAQP
jgi:uncharacterized membrane protein YdbT with pleckstrin-like domain